MLSLTISEIMTKDVFYVTLDQTVKEADDIMRNENIRHVPVVDNGKFVGLITERSLSDYTLKRIYDYEDEYGEIGYNKISDFRNIMAKDVHIIYPEDSLKKAIEIMTKYKVDCLPVVDWQNNLVGIVTSIDILLFIYRNL